METKLFDIRIYQQQNGKEPFVQWVEQFDSSIRSRLFARLDRVHNGNFGDHKSVGNNIYELRFHFGAGYRIYFGREDNKIVVLLAGGSKASQTKDIKLAKSYWEDYQRRNDKKSSNI